MKISGGKLILFVSVGVVILSVLIGLFIIESPIEHRLEKLDSRRIYDLRYIANNIDFYWTLNDSLPPDLETLIIKTQFKSRINDPVSGAPYLYNIVSEDSFKLCATFETESSNDPYGSFMDGRKKRVWVHPKGFHCFEIQVQRERRAAN